MTKLNKRYGLTEIYHCDINDMTGRCRKCGQKPKQGDVKLCAVIGKEEVANFRVGDDNDWK